MSNSQQITLLIFGAALLLFGKKQQGVSGFHRRRYFGGNSGYSGYSMSLRAIQARNEGKYPKTDFKKVYYLTPKVFDLLVGCEVIMSYEWHHTSSYGHETPFYEWDTPNYNARLADSVYENPFYKIYKENKEELTKLSRDKGIYFSKHYRTGEKVVVVPQEIKERVWQIFDI